MAHSGGSIAFFGTFRPLVPLDIFSLPANSHPSSAEQRLTDGVSYNHNGRAIRPAPLKELLAFLAKKDPPVKCGATPDDVDKGLVTAIVLVSERDNGLETLHVSLSVKDKPTPTVLSLRDIYGPGTFSGVRMEDSGGIAGGFTAGSRAVGHSLVYVSTKEPAKARRTPWTAVYKTNLADGSTERLTPQYQYDINPAVSPSGKRVAVANFRFNQWTGEIDRLNTDIVVMNVDRQAQGGLGRSVVIKDGGWPTWGSDNVIFFHRGRSVADRRQPGWQVFRYDLTTKKIDAMTPENIDAMTPAAIDENKVAVAAIRAPFGQQAVAPEQRTDVDQFRQIEIYELRKPADPVVITSNKTDHYNPFVLQRGSNTELYSVGFHRCRDGDAEKKFSMLQSPPTHQDVALYRGAGVFPTFTNKGSELAYVDNDFRTVYVADGGDEPRAVYKHENSNKILSVTWNQKHDTLYCCIGTAFTGGEIQIWAIYNVCDEDTNKQSWKQLTDDTKQYNNAFPSSNKDGYKLVFRSSCDRSGGDKKFKNLYIMEDATEGDSSAGEVTQLTKGDWTDTHCCWSPTDDWIVFSSSRDRAPPGTDPALLDAGCFSIFLVNYHKRDVVVRVMHSAMSMAGHVCHPVFSPDRTSIVLTSDVAGVSADPASLPIFIHSVRPYGDIFIIKLRDPDCLEKNGDIRDFDRITHSRYENSTPTWTDLGKDPKLTVDPNDLLTGSSTGHAAGPCPFLHSTAYKC